MAGGTSPTGSLRRRLKHGNTITVCASGHKHRSKAEARRCDHLSLLQRVGEISDLQQQPRFPCVLNGAKLCTYVADFAYNDHEGRRIIEDVKGHKTQLYRLKKKLVEAIYVGTEIVEVLA
jgi:hypothetical protein